MENNVIPLRTAQMSLVVAPAGQALPADVSASIIADYQSSAALWRLVAIAMALVAGYEYLRYVRPAKRQTFVKNVDRSAAAIDARHRANFMKSFAA